MSDHKFVKTVCAALNKEISARKAAVFHFDRVIAVPIHSKANSYFIPKYVSVLTQDTVCIRKADGKFNIGLSIHSTLDMPWRRDGNATAYVRALASELVADTVEEVIEAIRTNLTNHPKFIKDDKTLANSKVVGRSGIKKRRNREGARETVAFNHSFEESLEFVKKIISNLE